MTQDNSRQVGQLLMAGALLQLIVFIAGATRRSYAAVALPVGGGVAVISALAFWVGYTMATTNWDDPPDFGLDDAQPMSTPAAGGAAADTAAAERAPADSLAGDGMAEAEGAPPAGPLG